MDIAQQKTDEKKKRRNKQRCKYPLSRHARATNRTMDRRNRKGIERNNKGKTNKQLKKEANGAIDEAEEVTEIKKQKQREQQEKQIVEIEEAIEEENKTAHTETNSCDANLREQHEQRTEQTEKEEEKTTLEENRPAMREQQCWGKIGLVEYNAKTTRWECRINDCEDEIDTAKKYHIVGKNTILNSNFGPDQQEMTCPYCRKTMNAMRRLFIHLKIQPQAGNWNVETCPKLTPEETPRGKWAKILLRMKGAYQK